MPQGCFRPLEARNRQKKLFSSTKTGFSGQRNKVFRVSRWAFGTYYRYCVIAGLLNKPQVNLEDRSGEVVNGSGLLIKRILDQKNFEKRTILSRWT